MVCVGLQMCVFLKCVATAFCSASLCVTDLFPFIQTELHRLARVELNPYTYEIKKTGSKKYEADLKNIKTRLVVEFFGLKTTFFCNKLNMLCNNWSHLCNK